MSVVTRFAPSPTGYLHLGHAYSARIAHDAARAAGGRFLLRIEDIDAGRCRAEFEDSIREDLVWLGLEWDGEVRRQSEHFADYHGALAQLAARDLLYPCFCTRKAIQAEIAAADSAPHGPDGALYPGTCRALDPAARQDRLDRGDAHALRLDMAAASRQAGPLEWQDETEGRVRARPDLFGDVVLARKDTPTSYHLAVTIDDHLQGVTLVTRGADLFAATHVHRLLQALLGLATPAYRHHPLLTDPAGKRFAKRDRALTIASLRENGATPDQVWDMVGGFLMA